MSDPTEPSYRAAPSCSWCRHAEKTSGELRCSWNGAPATPDYVCDMFRPQPNKSAEITYRVSHCCETCMYCHDVDDVDDEESDTPVYHCSVLGKEVVRFGLCDQFQLNQYIPPHGYRVLVEDDLPDFSGVEPLKDDQAFPIVWRLAEESAKTAKEQAAIDCLRRKYNGE